MQEKAKILVVDDEPHNILILKGHLSKMGHEVVGAENAVVALDKLDTSYDLVLSDVMMPTMNGFEFVEKIRENPDLQRLPVVMVTTLSEKNDRLKAVEAGANDFITKPVDRLELSVRVASMLKMKRQQDEIDAFETDLNILVEERTLKILDYVKQLKKAHQDTIVHLSAAAEYKDEETGTHIIRMSKYSALLAERLGMCGDDVDLILKGSPMHDVGKIGIPDSILMKPGKLTLEEWEVMKTHTTIGANILGMSSSNYMNTAAIIAISHHEKWDGSGYPSGLVGENIPVEGRICAVTDVFDALTNERPYKKAFSVEKSIEIMKEGRKTHFDPHILDVFLDNLDDILEIKENYAEM